LAWLGNLSYSRGGGRRKVSWRQVGTNLVRPYLENKIQTKGLGCDSSGESKFKALGSISSTTKNKEQKERIKVTH
jgi:hypothetical protein